jgi:GxxExxY protein
MRVTASRSKKGYNFEALSGEVLGACIEVQRQLGRHCMEADYQRALGLELGKRGIQFQREFEMPIADDSVVATRRRVDFLIWDDTDELLLETKARKAILDEDIEQCLLYLQNGNYQVCLLVNFGEKPLGRKRLVYTPKPEDLLY